ncbi:MAG: outer membrane protein transport protein [Alphaproteobacteria bacterium]|nr:outer membrane protein transport protein [Alphaproteobacteria bacterium]
MIALVSAALAGGYFYSDSGIVAAGRGGAFIAGADTQFAQYYNPAGLVRIEHPTVNVGFSSVQQHISFARLDEEAGLLEPVKNQAAPFVVPQLGFATPLVKGKLALAVGMVSPFAPSSDYDALGEQRYSIIRTSIYQFSYGPSLAYRPIKYVTFGLSLQAKVLILEETLAVSASGALDPGGDLLVTARASDPFTPNINLGVLIDPIEQVTIGLAVQPATRFDAKGTASLDLSNSNLGAVVDKPVYQDGGCTLNPSDPEDPCSSEDGIGLEIQLPLVVRAGVAVRPTPELEIEAAVVYQNWKKLEDITLTGIDPDIYVFGSPEPTEIPDEFQLPAGLRDTVSVRLGGEWRVNDEIELRAGGFWENGSVKPQGMSVALVDPWKVQLGTGFSLWPLDGRLRLDGALAGIFFPGFEIRDSEVRQVYVDVLNRGGEGAIVGNGDLKAQGWLVGLQASWIFKGWPK